MNWKDYYYKTAMILVSQVIQEVDGINETYPSAFFEDIDESFLKKIEKPSKNSLLHDYIKYIHEFGTDYVVDKGGYDCIINEIFDALDNYKINYRKMNEEENDMDLRDEYYDYVLELYYNLTPQIVDETFYLLFMNKKFLSKFNESIAEIITNMKEHNYPGIMRKDGVINRCSYLPTWLKQGVYFRDKGRCQLCGKDLTTLLHTDVKIHYDHIIPLELGGTNDPTNFQLTCEACNTSKGARNCKTSNLTVAFW